MDLLELAPYAQIGAFVGLFAYLLVALYQIRVERHIYWLMSAEAEAEDDSAVYSHQYRDQTQIGMATQWERLSWDEKMRYLRLEHRLNWGAAIAGGVTVISGLIWGNAELVWGWDEGLGTGWLVAVGVSFIAGLFYLLYSHYQRWKRGRADYLRMKE
ncbi:MAG: hypothetical protein R6U70_02465 [Bacillota bacterium]